MHLTVRLDEQEYVTTQLVFDDALGGEIIGSQPLYNARGQRDTKNTNDLIIADRISEHAFETKRMEDGAMLAWKTIVIRSSLSTPTCQLGPEDGMPPGSDGGMPPPGGTMP